MSGQEDHDYIMRTIQDMVEEIRRLGDIVYTLKDNPRPNEIRPEVTVNVPPLEQPKI